MNKNTSQAIYRVAADKPVIVEGPKYGLIITAKTKPHKCNKPGDWVAFYRWLLRMTTIADKSLWRCKCGEVYRRDSYYSISSNSGWDSVSITLWTDYGGVK